MGLHDTLVGARVRDAALALRREVPDVVAEEKLRVVVEDVLRAGRQDPLLRELERQEHHRDAQELEACPERLRVGRHRNAEGLGDILEAYRIARLVH